VENQKNNKGVIALLIIIIVILSALCILFATGTISFNMNNKKDNTVNEDSSLENNEDSSLEKKEYNATDYIILEDVVFNSRVSTKKVKLKNLDDNITKDFYEQQNNVINSIHAYDSEEFNAEYKLKTFINSSILSIIYTIEETNAIGTCGTKMAVVNIDLANNKIISEKELLEKVGITYKSLVEEQYEKRLESWKKTNEYNGFEIDYYDVTFADFRDNKEKYVNEGITKIPDIIYTYIQDGKIKYDYYSILLDTLFHPIGKGGCFTWKTVDLGNYQ